MDDLHSLNQKINYKFGNTSSARLIWKSNSIKYIEKENYEKLLNLLNSLEENNDVQCVSSDFEASGEMIN